MVYKRTKQPKCVKNQRSPNRMRVKEALASEILPEDCPVSLWKGMSRQLIVFCVEYIVDFNGARAVRDSSFTNNRQSAAVQATYWLREENVRCLIKWLLKKRSRRLQLTMDKTLRTLMDLAFFDPRDFAEWDQDGVVLAPSVEIDSRSIRAIKSVQSNPRTGTKIEFNDRLKALELLGRHQGLFNDKLTIAGDPENPLLNVDKTLEFLTKLATGKETTE